MPIGYNPDVINPGGIDYAEVDNLINPPNPANAGKAIVIDEDGKPTLGEGGGGGGGGSIGVLYMLEIEPSQTDPDLPEGNWSNEATPVATSPDAETPMTYTELVDFFNDHPFVCFAEDGDVSVGYYPGTYVTYSHGVVQPDDKRELFAYFIEGSTECGVHFVEGGK